MEEESSRCGGRGVRAMKTETDDRTDKEGEREQEDAGGGGGGREDERRPQMQPGL